MHSDITPDNTLQTPTFRLPSLDLADGIVELHFKQNNSNRIAVISEISIIATDGWIGRANTNSDVVLFTTGDMDGDGTEETWLIRQRNNGIQELKIYRQHLNGEQWIEIYDGSVALYETYPVPLLFKQVGNANDDTNIALAIIGDYDIDGQEDDIVFIRQKSAGEQWLEIFDGSEALSEPTPVPLVSVQIGNSGDDSNVTRIAAGDFDADGVEDDIAVIRLTASGAQQLGIYEGSRIVTEGVLGSPIAGDLDIGTIRIILMSGID